MAVRYPIARSSHGQLVHIDAWRDEDVACIGCGQPMVGKRGSVNAHHFAHAVERSCSAETVLHAGTKEAVVSAHARAPIRLWWSCVACGETRRATTAELDLVTEAAPCDGVRSDVLGRDLTGAPRLAIEVVVTHALEPQTIARYRAAGVSVLLLRPTWEVFRELASGAEIMVDGRHALDEHVGACAGCDRLRTRTWWDAHVAAWQALGSVYADDERSRQFLLNESWSAFVRQWRLVAARFARHFDYFVDLWRKIGQAHADDLARWRSFAVGWSAIAARLADQQDLRARESASRAFADAQWWDRFIAAWSRTVRRWVHDQDPRRWDDFVATWRAIGAHVHYNWLTATEPSGRPRTREVEISSSPERT